MHSESTIQLYAWFGSMSFVAGTLDMRNSAEGEFTWMMQLYCINIQVQTIEGLHHCQNLIKLHLYSNRITRIDGLESLLKLEKLWLNGNAISAIEVCGG